MKKLRNKIGIGSMMFFMLLTSCNSFEDINTNPDASSVVSPSMLCTNIVLNIARYSGRDAKAFISDNALPKYVGYAVEGQLGTQYNQLGSSGFGGITNLPNINKMIESAKGSITEDSYKGVGKFARAYIFYNMTMEMGDIPYSEANLGMAGNYKPKYDSQEAVFLGILNELKEADQFFANGVKFMGDPTPYNGDPAKWRRATNALALKVLMSLSKKTGAATLEVQKRFSDIVAANYLLENNATSYFGLVYSTQNKHPLSGTSDMFTRNTIVSSLMLDSLKAYNDRRLYYFAEPSAAKISGGLNQTNFDAYVGVDVSMDFSAMNADHAAKKYSLINKRYLAEAACEPRMLLTFAEQQLILAEARVKGWITSGSAKTYYEEGVKSALSAIMATKSSYAHTKAIDQTYINGYFTGNAAFKTNVDEQLKQIWMQRYFLNFMQDSESAFFEFRRTGFPNFPINPATSMNQNNKNAIPMRWLYPGTETDYNRENLIVALNNQYEGYDEINKIMWLLK
ncbi:MAG: SusD/RagB family nutrient-binding outer membrane lipoprotein [Bacteroidales bacterium]|nr:SusD/RagB family nutrient-binding outer membrane lipoprotein [Bacteroidales bacterium]